MLRFSHCAERGGAVSAGMDFETLSRWAVEELQGLKRALPDDVREASSHLVVTFEEVPDTEGADVGLAGDELGLFEGTPLGEEEDPAGLPRIRLFLGNLWEWVEGDEDDFRDEVGTTYLHELGHYLGWDEDDLADRGLE
jgi:predicted Zn-dependent protease with MMP-like domain